MRRREMIESIINACGGDPFKAPKKAEVSWVEDDRDRVSKKVTSDQLDFICKWVDNNPGVVPHSIWDLL